MKLLRLWLLVLLAALLPVRGAMAAAMLCPPAGGGTQHEMRLADHAAMGHAQDLQAQAHPHHHDDRASHGQAVPGHDKCNLCAAFCSLTPLLSEVAGVAEPRDLADAPFPRLLAPAPSFLSDGQERPPRSI